MKRIEALTRLWITAGVLVSTVAVSPSLAGHMHVDFPTLVHTSQVIVDGHITHVQSRQDALGLIVTDITLDVLDVWHADAVAMGHLGSRLTWTVPGGTVGAKTLSTGVAHFEPGERIVAFAMLDGQRWLDPFIGADQGVFRVLEQGHNAPLPCGPTVEALSTLPMETFSVRQLLIGSRRTALRCFDRLSDLLMALQ